jgi:hypothetical protein
MGRGDGGGRVMGTLFNCDSLRPKGLDKTTN